MDKISLKIQLLYSNMGNAEKRIADWILANPGEILPLSIVDLADKCKCGEATIVRFSKRLGCSGYQELKISLAQETTPRSISEEITSDDTCHDIFQKLTNEIYCSLEATKSAIDKEALQKAAELILNARSSVFCGLGNSASVAQDAAHKLLRAGKHSYAYIDNHLQSIAASQLKKDDVAVGISHSGSSKDIIDALKIAKERGATTICITNKGKSPILKCSDVALFTSSPEIKYTILGLNSRIAALAVIDSIYSYIVCNDKNAQKSIELTEFSLKSKKF